MDKKKLFALASFSAIAGVFVATSSAGCSSSTTSTPSTDAGKDAKPPPAPPSSDDGGGGMDASTTCPSSDPVTDSDLPYESPHAIQMGACTDADQKALHDSVAAMKFSDDELKAAVSKTCAACVFTDATMSGWGVFPEAKDMSGALNAVTIDVGGCYELVTMNAACGKALQNFQDCSFIACDGCPQNDQTAFDNCIKKAAAGVCKTYAKNYQTMCGAVDMNLFQQASDNCDGTMGQYIFEGPVSVQCGKGVVAADGGG